MSLVFSLLPPPILSYPSSFHSSFSHSFRLIAEFSFLFTLLSWQESLEKFLHCKQRDLRDRYKISLVATDLTRKSGWIWDWNLVCLFMYSTPDSNPRWKKKIKIKSMNSRTVHIERILLKTWQRQVVKKFSSFSEVESRVSYFVWWWFLMTLFSSLSVDDDRERYKEFSSYLFKVFLMFTFLEFPAQGAHHQLQVLLFSVSYIFMSVCLNFCKWIHV